MGISCQLSLPHGQNSSFVMLIEAFEGSEAKFKKRACGDDRVRETRGKLFCGPLENLAGTDAKGTICLSITLGCHLR